MSVAEPALLKTRVLDVHKDCLAHSLLASCPETALKVPADCLHSYEVKTTDILSRTLLSTMVERTKTLSNTSYSEN